MPSIDDEAHFEQSGLNLKSTGPSDTASLTIVSGLSKVAPPRRLVKLHILTMPSVNEAPK